MRISPTKCTRLHIFAPVFKNLSGVTRSDHELAKGQAPSPDPPCWRASTVPHFQSLRARYRCYRGTPTERPFTRFLRWTSGVFTIGPLERCPSPALNWEKISRMTKKVQPKCAIFRQKSQKFSGEGAQTLPPLGREIPLTRPLNLGAAALDHLQFFSQFLSLGYARYWCCYWRIWEIESSASFVSRPRPIKWNAFRNGTS